MSQTEKPRRSYGFWIASGILFLMTGGVLVTYNYMLFRKEMLERARNIPPIKELPEFRLVDQDGKAFTRADMSGRIWLVNFIFTSCPGPCVALTQDMAAWQKKVRDMDDVGLLTLTVDPERDTPEVLADYAARHGAETSRWTFVTGQPEAQMELIRKGFMLVVAPQQDPMLAASEGTLIHSTRLVLVDQRTMIRGYYDTKSPEAMDKLLGDITHLQREYGPSHSPR